MKDTIGEYLRKRADLDTWPLARADTRGIGHAVVIPALAECPALFDTLSDLAASPREALDRTLVIVVVNNRAEPHARAEDLENNRQTLEAFERDEYPAALRLAYVDASRPGHELPEKGGVGWARKIGLDWAAAVLHENAAPEGGVISLDADTRVDANYLPALQAFFTRKKGTAPSLAGESPILSLRGASPRATRQSISGSTTSAAPLTPGPRWAAVVDYAHPTDDPELGPAMLAYELFLRYHELGLYRARSPYAFPTIGSTIACTARAYASVAGMNRRQAGEDFYFLQQLAKTGSVERITATTVRPAARRSHRVPFGTGASLGRFGDDPAAIHQVYHPAVYTVLGAWVHAVREGLGDDGPSLIASAECIAPELAAFLLEQGFPAAWDQLRKNHREPQRLWRQFHGWFDAFRTLKLIHHLRDHGYPQTDPLVAFEALFAELGLTPPQTRGDDPEDQRRLLQFLRQYSRTLPPGGLAAIDPILE
jgi:hypothetical protein